MKTLPRADAVVITVNSNHTYTRWIPWAAHSWRNIGITPYIFYVHHEGTEPSQHPDVFRSIEIPKEWSTSSFAQVSRLLLPAVIKAENVLITDIDYIVFPSPYWRYTKGHPANHFVGMRKKRNINFYMGFNCAAPKVWNRFFAPRQKLSCCADVVAVMRSWLVSGRWNPSSWGCDQRILNSELKTRTNVVGINPTVHALAFEQGKLYYADISGMGKHAHFRGGNNPWLQSNALLGTPNENRDDARVFDLIQEWLSRGSIRGIKTPQGRRLFCLWTGDNPMSATRKEHLQSIRDNVDLPIVLVTRDNLDVWVPQKERHSAYEFLSATHRADYLRCFLMHKYGGAYCDIKPVRRSWRQHYDDLMKDDTKWICGYREQREQDVACGPGDNAKTVKSQFRNLVGTPAFIMKPDTEFTRAWMEYVSQTLDRHLDKLREFPARGPREQWRQGSDYGYPLRWLELLGEKFHPLQLQYLGRISYVPELFHRGIDYRGLPEYDRRLGWCTKLLIRRG